MNDRKKAEKCIRGYLDNEEIEDKDEEMRIGIKCCNCHLKEICLQVICERLGMEKEKK